MAQAYYLEGDFANAAAASRAALDRDAEAGREPSESLLEMLANSAYQQKDDAGFIAALEQLVAHYPKTDHWSDLLRAVRRKPGFAGRLTLELDQLMVATGAMDNAAAFMEAAELALEEGFPGTAQSILDKGYAAGTLGNGAEADRERRLQDMAKRQSSKDRGSLPQLAADAAAAADGLGWVRLGEAYASYGNYDEASAAFEKGLAKGGLKYPEDAKLERGIAERLAGRRATSEMLLKSVAGTDGTRDLAQLWLLKK
jgi:tetratricopeptide (TPR) repeat protein